MLANAGKNYWIFCLWTFLSGCQENPTAENNQEPKELSRFEYEVVAEGLNEPMQMDFDGNGNVMVIERGGNLLFISEDGSVKKKIGTVPLAEVEAPGLVGILLARDFLASKNLFLYYSAEKDKGNYMRLSRFTLDEEDNLMLTSEKVLLKIFWEQPDGQHMGGGMVWDLDDNLLLSVGCDTSPSQYAPLEFTNPGGRGEDASRTAGNTFDMRGAIIRISPKGNGSYEIPEGNLFAPGKKKTLPEIYIMGNRNPWRLSIDSETGFLHWGEVGPDAGIDAEKRGPMGYDEFNVAKKAGNFGWPFFIGDNLSYRRFDYEEGEYLEPFDPRHPVNFSPNNTGIDTLPPAEPSLLAYPYGVSEEWPILQSAARSAVGGPVFRGSQFEGSDRIFPGELEGKWIVTDYVRNWIMVLNMDENRENVLDIEPLIPSGYFPYKQVLDMDFGPKGDLYLVEYGINGQGKLSRITYNRGNRPPSVKGEVRPTAGALPLTLSLSAEGSFDPDGDSLNFSWEIHSEEGKLISTFEGKEASLELESTGRFSILLSVTDTHGAVATREFDVVAGNERPFVDLLLTGGNRSFYFPGNSIQYEVKVSDREDGSLEKGTISEKDVAVTAEYISGRISAELIESWLNEGKVNEQVSLESYMAISQMEANNCMACHKLEEELVGPSFEQISYRYSDQINAKPKIIQSILEGSEGKWGTAVMPPHSMIPSEELTRMANFITGLSKNSGQDNMPIKGSYTMSPQPLQGSAGRLGKFFEISQAPGALIIKAEYSDKGIGKKSNDISLRDYDYLKLRYPILAPEEADVFSEEGISFTPATDDPGFFITGKGGYIGFKDLDLTGVDHILLGAVTRFWHWTHFIGGEVEVRLEDPQGSLLGSKEVIAQDVGEGQGPFFGEAAGEPLQFDVSHLNGSHDLYFIVNNPKAKEGDALVILTGIKFVPSN